MEQIPNYKNQTPNTINNQTAKLNFPMYCALLFDSRYDLVFAICDLAFVMKP
jgi:hypothetical protein